MGEPRFGVLANVGEPDSSEDIERVCRTADGHGYDALAFGDHLSWSISEAWTVLSWAAGFTERIGLTHLVLNNTYRHPSLLAHMGASLDFLSDGRFELGIGAGSTSRNEYRPYGFVYAPFRERIGRLKESLTIIERLWENGHCDFEGEYFQVRDASLQPKPAQDPRPPVLIGGRSEELMDLAVNYEGWNYGFDLSPDDCRRRLDDFQRRCTNQGADPNSYQTPVGVLLIISESESKVENQVSDMASQHEVPVDEFLRNHADSFIGTPDEIRPKVKAYEDVGVEEFYLWGPSVSDPVALKLFASEVMSEVG